MRALLVFSALLIASLALGDAACEHGKLDSDDPNKCLSCDKYWRGDTCEDIDPCVNGKVKAVAEGDPPADSCESCESYWTGVHCEQILCVNGGYAKDGVCHCPKGYYGIHCDAVKQARPVEGVFETEKSFSLYIHNELTDWYGKSGFKRIISEVKNYVPTYKFDNHNLFVSYRPKRADPTPAALLFDVQTKLTWTTFVEKLDELEGGERTETYTCDPTDISYASILEALQENQIEDTVMLMYTQYPPKKDDQALAVLKKYLRAFRIKLNVLIGADDILLDCNSKKNKNSGFDELTSLVHFTDGEIAPFLVEDDKDENELVPSFVRASASPQYHYRQASATCQSTALDFQTDPYPNNYYIAVRSTQGKPATIVGTCSSGGEVSEPILSYYSEFTLFTILSGAQQRCQLNVTTDTECVATVYSVGGEEGVDSFDIFHSFSTTADMDTDSIYAYHNESYYLTMHIQVPQDSTYKIKTFTGQMAVYNEGEREELLSTLTSRLSTYEYISDGPFACDKDGSSWIQLNLEGFTVKGDSVAVLNRIINLNCVERESTVGPTPKILRMMDDASKNLPTFALMYSNDLPTQQYSRFILPSVEPSLMENKFSQYGYLRFDGRDTMNFIPTSNFQDFRKGVYDNGPDKDLGYLNNIKAHLEQLTASSTPVTSDSLVSIAIDHSMTDPTLPGVNVYPSNLAQLANLGAKLLFWGDVDTVTVDADSLESLEFYTRLAAVSAGHVVLIDMKDFEDDDDPDESPPFYVSLALRDMYSFGPSQRLLSYSNLQWTPTGGVTTQTASIGTLQIPEGTTQVFVSITLNVANPSDVGQAFQMSIVLEGMADRPVLNFADFTTYGGSDRPRSNLYTANITVMGGESYEGTFTVLAMTPYTGAHIRFWTARTGDDVIPDLTYVDFDKKTIQPDDYVGAALRVNSDGVKMSLRFLNESGIEGKLLDHEQPDVAVTNGVAHFVPYFCVSDQSESLSRDMYTVEITYDSGFKYFRPLLCSKGKDPDALCRKEEGGAGNWYCNEPNPPFHRGPSKKLIDCSGNGQVVYSDDANDPNVVNSYRCNCIPGSDGLSCEKSSCAFGLEHLPEEQDTSFRTLSYVLLSPAGEDACSVLALTFAEEAKQLFKEGSTYDNFWQYTFSVYFTDGTARTLYRGPNFRDFYNVFNTMNIFNDDFDPETFCGSEDDTKPINLTDVFNLAVESVGRNSRGIVFIHAMQTFVDNYGEEKNMLLKAFGNNELYQSIQAYQQHIYMVTPTITADFITMTTASGGFVVRMVDYYDDFKASTTNYRDIFDGLFKSKIGWAGILTQAKTTSWKITKEAELFITTENEAPGVGDVPVDPFSSNNEYGEGAISSHASIESPTTITVTFNEGTDYGLVQVVILTKEDPIQNALLGQGQVNTDKHAAGATTSSQKAVHVSFNKLTSEFVFEPKEDTWRQASRIDCSFAQEFVPTTQPFNNIGASVVDFTVSPVDATATSFSLSVPLAVSETIDCVNGDFSVEGSFCKCEGGWSGPTCSQPSCENGGMLNSHGDHCDCSNAPFGGLFCKDESTKMTFEEE